MTVVGTVDPATWKNIDPRHKPRVQPTASKQDFRIRFGTAQQNDA